MHSFNFKCNEGLDPTISISSKNSDSWNDQARDFYHFLLAQGFIVSEKALAKFYKEAAEEIGNLRGND